MWTYDEDEVLGLGEGDIFTLDGRQVRITKKTTTAISVENYNWYHKLFDTIRRKFGKRSN